jgi:hypothetical protein
MRTEQQKADRTFSGLGDSPLPALKFKSSERVIIG